MKLQGGRPRYLSHLDPQGLPGGLAVDLVQHGGELAPRTTLVNAGHQLGLGVLTEDLAHALFPLDGGADLFGEVLLNVLGIHIDLGCNSIHTKIILRLHDG